MLQTVINTSINIPKKEQVALETLLKAIYTLVIGGTGVWMLSRFVSTKISEKFFGSVPYAIRDGELIASQSKDVGTPITSKKQRCNILLLSLWLISNLDMNYRILATILTKKVEKCS